MVITFLKQQCMLLESRRTIIFVWSQLPTPLRLRYSLNSVLYKYGFFFVLVPYLKVQNNQLLVALDVIVSD